MCENKKNELAKLFVQLEGYHGAFFIFRQLIDRKINRQRIIKGQFCLHLIAILEIGRKLEHLA